MQCPGGQCYKVDGRCDSYPDISILVGRDQLYYYCHYGQWRCYNGQCIDIDGRCDSVPDCYDASDENCKFTRIFKDTVLSNCVICQLNTTIARKAIAAILPQSYIHAKSSGNIPVYCVSHANNIVAVLWQYCGKILCQNACILLRGVRNSITSR